jgi:hypothetical protein
VAIAGYIKSYSKNPSQKVSLWVIGGLAGASIVVTLVLIFISPSTVLNSLGTAPICALFILYWVRHTRQAKASAAAPAPTPRPSDGPTQT